MEARRRRTRLLRLWTLDLYVTSSFLFSYLICGVSFTGLYIVVEAFSKLNHRDPAGKEFDDLVDGVDHLIAAGLVDRDRVGVTGGSYGGHMTLAVATYYPERIRCAVDVVGISNFVSFLENTESYRRDLRRVEYGDERDPKMRAFMEKIAPVNNAAKIKRPLFVIQGKNDPRVPLIEAEQMVATLKKHNTPVWYLMATDEGHGFAKKRNADFQFYATVMFMREHLLDKQGK